MSSTCIVCGQINEGVQKEITDYLVSHEQFKLETCANCGFKYFTNPPKAQDAGAYYESADYVEHSDETVGFIHGIYGVARKLMLKIKFSKVDKVAKQKSILDFGTGTGYFLNHMKSKGYRTLGIEISDKARSFGKQNFGLELKHPDFLFSSDMPTDIGVVTFWHVLEHIYNVEEVLTKLHDVTMNDATIVVALPNYLCLEEKEYKKYWNGYDAPRHLWHFTPASFTEFAHKCGYKVVKKEILPLDPFYNCLISESYRKSLWGYIKLPFVSTLSLIQGWMNVDKASSVIYFLEKATPNS